MGITIISTGKAVPQHCVTNEDLAQYMETNDQWIRERTGVVTRHIAFEESSADLAISAIETALKNAPHPIDPADIDLLIVPTITPDQIVPGMGCIIRRRMQMGKAVTFDINAACSGFVYGLWLAESLLKTGNGKIAVVVATERLTRIGNWDDRSTCVLFGDGAGCAIVEADDTRPGILGSYIKNYDDVKDTLTCGMEYRPIPFCEDHPEPQYLKMAGQQVFRFAVTSMGEVIGRVLEEAGMTPDDVDWYVPHQANMRIIQASAERLGQPLEKFSINIDTCGNVSAASLSMALADLMDSGKVKPGDKIMLVGFGGGLSAAAMLCEAS